MVGVVDGREWRFERERFVRFWGGGRGEIFLGGFFFLPFSVEGETVGVVDLS